MACTRHTSQKIITTGKSRKIGTGPNAEERKTRRMIAATVIRVWT